MNILRYKQKAQGWMAREDGDGGGDSSSGWGGGGNFGGYTTGSTTNATDSGQVSTAQNNYSSGTASDGSWGADFNSPISGFTTDIPAFQNPDVASVQPEQPSIDNSPEMQAQVFALNKMNFDEKNPDWTQGVQLAPQLQKSLGQLYSGYTTGSGMNVQNQDQADRASMLAGQDAPPSWAQAHGIIPGMSKESYFNQQTPAERVGIMKDVGNGISTVGNAMISAMMPAPMRLAMSGVQAYDKYQQNPSMGAGTAIAQGLQGAGGITGALANLYNGNYGSALSGGLRAGGVTGMAPAVAGIGADYATGKNIAPSLGGLAGQFAGQSLGGSVGGAFGRSLGQQMSRMASLRK